MVDGIAFKGNRAIPGGELASIIATERTGIWRRWFGWNVGLLTCLDSVELGRDAQRVAELYAQRGYPGSTVAASVRRHGDRRAAVAFTVVQSAPLLVDSVAITSLPGEAANAKAFERRLRLGPFDDSVFHYTVDSIQGLLHAAGYARALPPDTVVVRDSVRRRVSVIATFHPQRISYVGPIAVTITAAGKKPALDSTSILKLLRFKPGDRYRSRVVGASQRDLYELELYKSIKIDAEPADSVRDTLPLLVRLAEGDRRRLRAGGGWGTLDCFRAQLRFVSNNLLFSGHRLELDGRLSKIGVSQPFTSLSSLCAPRVRTDPFSTRLNYYAGATINLRGVPGASLKPTLTVYSERRSELGAYEQSTDIGAIASLTRELLPRLIGRAQLQYQDSRTIADGAVSCTKFGICRIEDLRGFLENSPIYSAGVGLVKNPLLPTDDPVDGMRWQTEVRQGYTNLARTTALSFTRVMGELAIYKPLNAQFVVAARAQLGYVFAPASVSWLLPPQERFYAGGQNSVRGYDQNLLGPGSYIVTQYADSMLADGTGVGVARSADGYQRIAPSGGNAMWVANIELRTRQGWPGGLFRYVAFVDAGRVWNTNDVFSVTNAVLRITPGVGVRLITPLGPFRVDIGYNPNDLDTGPAFFLLNGEVLAGKLGRAICVSPGTTDPLVLPAGATSGAPFCPATFVPAQRNGLLPRLAFHFSIGQAF